MTDAEPRHRPLDDSPYPVDFQPLSESAEFALVLVNALHPQCA